MDHRIELGHVVIEVPDPTSLTPTFAEVVGLEAGDPTPGGALTWRNDDHAQRVIVTEGPANDAVAVGFEAVDAAAFEATVERLRAHGCDVVEDAELAAERRADRLIRTAAPWGPDVELVLGAERAATPFASDLVPGGFLTEDVGFGHVVLATTAFEESRALLGALGFTQSDWLEMEIAEGIELEVRFFHCNARHHTVALAKAPFDLPQTLHHVMFEMNERDDVGAAFDRLWASDLGIPNGLGRHDNDGMFSFYLRTPAGFQIEVGHGARVITDDWDDDRAYDAISSWGHQPLRP
jgi:2,3-dihydroxybiphenyl 1,2-dioxygenase